MTDGAATDTADTNVQDVPPGYVAVDVVAQDGNGANLLAELLQAGLIESGASYGSVASGYVASDMIGTIAKMDNVVSASAAPSTTQSSAAVGIDQTQVHPGLVDPSAVIGQTQVHPGVVDPSAVITGQTTVHPGVVDPSAATAGQTTVHPGVVDPGFTHAVGTDQTSVHPGVVNPSAAGSGFPASATVAAPNGSGPTAAVNGDQLEAVDVIAKDGDGADLLNSLQTNGLMTGGASWGSMASGYVKASDFAKLGQQSDVVSAAISQSHVSAGLVDNEADHALMADTAKANLGVDGTGVTVGILSDSFNTSSNSTNPKTGARDTEATDIASNDLPDNTTVLNDSPNGTDEGRGMAQIVHDIAPGAAIKFDTANGGQAVFAQHILDLANAGCKVIVDDVGYFAEPSYQDGVIAQAIAKVKSMGVTYLSSAGNNGTNGYESSFHAGSTFTYNNTTYTQDLFGGQTSIPFVAGASQSISLEWAQPAKSAGPVGSASDLDLFITDSTGKVLNPVVNGATEGLTNNIGGDPVEVVSPTLTQGQTYYIQVGLKTGAAPADVRINVQDDGSGAVLGTVSDNTNTGTFYGHAASSSAIGVAAAPFTQTPPYAMPPTATATAESFTSPGPDNVYYDTNGNLLPSPQARQVSLTGVDGGETTFFGYGTGPNGYPQFFGTSAAAPSVAAVVALMLQKNPNLTPDQIENILKTTSTPAVDSSGAVDPAATGSGLVNALAAVAAACFADGTRIRLADGADVAVEDLVVGDLVETASGDIRPIRWLGHRTLRPGEHRMPSSAHPIQVLEGAFGRGLPERDLMLSPGHPVLVGADADNAGGHLVPIMCLINGTTIRRAEAETVTYWHIELDAHDVLLAEGLPAESYLDWGDRAFFLEGTDFELVNPDFIVPGLSARCRPVALDGPVVEAERRRLDGVFAMRLANACAWPTGEDAQTHFQ